MRRSALVALLAAAALAGGAWLLHLGPWRRPPPPAFVAAPEPPPPGARQRLRWMGHWLGEDKRETLVREVAREFAFHHPEVEVELRFPQEIMGVRSPKLAGEFIAEQVRKADPDWDVVWLDDVIYRFTADALGDPDWGLRHLVDFRAIPGFAQAHKPFITQDPAYAALTGGVLPGPFIEGEYTALWLNRELASRLGLSYPERGARWDDLVRLAEGLARKRAAGETEAYLLPETGDWFMSQYLFQGLVCSRFPDARDACDPSPSPAKRTAVREALAAFAALGRHQPLLPGHRQRLWMDGRRLPLDDRTLCYIGGTWMFSHWSGLDRARMPRMVPTPLPGLADTDHIYGGYIPTWAVLRHARGRTAGIDLLLYWSSADVAERWVAYTKNPTGLHGDLAALQLSEDPFDRFMVDMERRGGGRIPRSWTSDPAFALGPGPETRSTPFNELLRSLLAGEIAVEEALQRLPGIAGWDFP